MCTPFVDLAAGCWKPLKGKLYYSVFIFINITCGHQLFDVLLCFDFSYVRLLSRDNC